VAYHGYPFLWLQKVPFISDDLEIECEGKEKYKCGSNVFWKW
jgi:photosystem I subunit PsaN